MPLLTFKSRFVVFEIAAHLEFALKCRLISCNGQTKQRFTVLTTNDKVGQLSRERERSISFQGAMSLVCGTAALRHPSRPCRTVLHPQQHQPTATWYRRRAVQTSLQTRRSQPPCLSVCPAELQTVNADRCRLPRGRSDQETSLPSTPSSASTGVTIEIYCTPECLAVDAVDSWIIFPSTIVKWDGTRRSSWLAGRQASVAARL